MQEESNWCPSSHPTSTFLSPQNHYTWTRKPHLIEFLQWCYSCWYTLIEFGNGLEYFAIFRSKWRTQTSSGLLMKNSTAIWLPYHLHHPKQIFWNCWMNTSKEWLIWDVHFASLWFSYRSKCTSSHQTLPRLRHFLVRKYCRKWLGRHSFCYFDFNCYFSRSFK